MKLTQPFQYFFRLFNVICWKICSHYSTLRLEIIPVPRPQRLWLWRPWRPWRTLCYMARKSALSWRPIRFGSSTRPKSTTSFCPTGPTLATWLPPPGLRATWPRPRWGKPCQMFRHRWWTPTTATMATTHWFEKLLVMICDKIHWNTTLSRPLRSQAIVTSWLQTADLTLCYHIWKFGIF